MKIKGLLKVPGMLQNANNNEEIARGLSKKFKKREMSWYILRSNSFFKMIWDILVNTIFTLSFIMIPFVMCSITEIKGDFRWIEFGFDIVMFFDIIITFFTYNVDGGI